MKSVGYVRLEPQVKPRDLLFASKMKAIGYRELARRIGVSPTMVWLFSQGRVAMSQEKHDALRDIVKRVRSKEIIDAMFDPDVREQLNGIEEK